ncbi:hypothetical protein ACFVVX_29590 [Kitasatospora sp. NPDC058170]|uniref:hypothetical protein n=1 Tax=Kitasatospora sp. NPDC058170 TaxID=3346364 RepID=UPI0036D9AE17
MSIAQVVPAVEQPPSRTAPDTAPVRRRTRAALIAVRPAEQAGRSAGSAADEPVVRTRAAHCRIAMQYLD